MTIYYESEEVGKRTVITGYHENGKHAFECLGDTPAQATICFRTVLADYQRAYGQAVKAVRMPRCPVAR